jgi:chromatin structure-remodeling complex protein RSC7
MTRRAAAAAAAASMSSSLRTRPSRSSRFARDSSADGQDDTDGGPSAIHNDSDGDSSPRAQRRARITLQRGRNKRKVKDDEDEDEQDDEERAEAGAADEDVNSDAVMSPEDSSRPTDGARSTKSSPVKRGRGRPPKHRAIERLQQNTDDNDTDGDGLAGDETGNMSVTDAGDITRGGDETPIDGENVGVRDYTLINDEYELDADPEGDKKIDPKGNLQDGREFAFHTFTSPYRPDPEVRYCLSIDAAKIGGYRDSFYFYRNNPLLVKINCSEHEKDGLIELGSLSGHLRNRVVTMVAVRNVYKLHGARVIKNGRAVIDDYYEELARKTGRRPGQLVDSASANAPVPARLTERRQEARREMRQRERDHRRPDTFSHGLTDSLGNQLVTTFGDTGESPFERAKSWSTRRQNSLRSEINETTWMMEMARSVRGINAEILAGHAERRRGFPRPYVALDESDDESGDEIDKEPEQNGQAKHVQKQSRHDEPPIGVYEALSNVVHYPVTTQPRLARLERIYDRPLVGKLANGATHDAQAHHTHDSSSHPGKFAVLGGAKVGPGGWGIASIEQRVEMPARCPSPRLRVPAGHSAHER